MNDEKEINVDNAWNNVYNRVIHDQDKAMHHIGRTSFIRSTFIRVAAIALVILALGITALYLSNPDIFSRKITIATNDDQKNLKVEMPDGSLVFLNRNTEFIYRASFGKRNRNVILRGEAYFEIAPDVSKPFIIDAGEAQVKVVGTSFNVITRNSQSEVEVFVSTGKVLLTDNSDSESLALEPGYVGTISPVSSAKKINENPNYLSWKTGLLVYNGQKLDVVFSDLKRVYNMDIEVADTSILENRWTSPIDNQPQDTIIRLICASFNLSFTKEGNVYHLVRK